MTKSLLIVIALMLSAAPAQAWTCLPVKAIRPTILLSVDVNYSPETGWAIISHYPGGQIYKQIYNWHDYAVIENIDGSQWRGVPAGRHPPGYEGWSATGKLYLGEDGVMNYTEQTFEPSSKLYNQVDLKCHKEAIS